jgi:hypothetical protein
VCSAGVWVRETLRMVADGGPRWARTERMTGRAPIIRDLCADPSLFGSAVPLSLSDYRAIPTALTAQPGRRRRQRPARSASLWLPRNRPRASRPVRCSDRFWRYAGASARRMRSGELSVAGRSHSGGGGWRCARLRSGWILRAADGDIRSSHQLAVRHMSEDIRPACSMMYSVVHDDA